MTHINSKFLPRSWWVGFTEMLLLLCRVCGLRFSLFSPIRSDMAKKKGDISQDNRRLTSFFPSFFSLSFPEL